MSYLRSWWLNMAATALTETIDPNALALFQRGDLDLDKEYWPGTAYAISGRNLLRAVSAWCVSMKTTSVDGSLLWDLCIFRYMFAGDTLASNMVNIKSLDGSLDGYLPGGTLYELSGAGFRLLPTGTADAGYINTQLLPNDLSPSSNALSVYLTQNDPTQVQVLIGAADSGDGGRFFDLVRVDNVLYFENSAGGMMQAPLPDQLGRMTGTRTSTSTASLYHRGKLLTTATNVVNDRYPIYTVGIGNRHGDTGAYITLSTLGASDCWQGLTAGQEAAIYQIEQTYQTALKRAV